MHHVNLMIRLALALLLLALPATAQPEDGSGSDPIRFTRTIKVDDRRVRVPMRLYLAEESEKVVLLTLTGDLTRLQKRLPRILSREIANGCEDEMRVDVTSVEADARDIRITGRVEARRHLCLGERRMSELLRQTATVNLRLSGRVTGGCLRMRVAEAEIVPDGATGALLTATGVTERLSNGLRERVDEELAEGACLDLPDELVALDTRLTGGHFRELGEGGLGAVLNARMTVTAANVIALIRLLAEDGSFKDD